MVVLRESRGGALRRGLGGVPQYVTGRVGGKTQDAISPQSRGPTADWPAPAAAVLLLLIVALFGAVALLQPGLFASHDGVFHVYRLQALDTALRDGAIYPRWAGDFYFGYGSPIFNYLPMLPYYLGEAFHFLGIGYIASTKAVALVALLAAPVGAWLYARPLLSPPAALAVGIAYAFVPYRFVDLYTRGNFPEYLAFTWFPLVLWAFRRLLLEGDRRSLPIASLTLTALLMTHTPSALLFLVTLGAHIVVWAALRRGHVTPVLAHAAAALALGGIIAGAYLLPAFLDQGAVYAERLRVVPDFQHHFPTEGLVGLLSFDLVHRYGLGQVAPDVFLYRVGLAQWLLALAGGLVLLWRWRRLTRLVRAEAALMVALFSIAVLMCLPLSKPLWEAVPLLRTIQFPWRLLMLAALPSALLAGLAVDALAVRWQPLSAIGLALLLVPHATLDLRPPQSHFTEHHVTSQAQQALESTYAVLGTTTNAEWVPRTARIDVATVLRSSPWALANLRGEQGSPLAFVMPADVATAEALDWQGHQRSAQVSVTKATPVVFNLFHFPGWRAWVDDLEVSVTASEPEGLLTAEMPAGTHAVTLRFDDTPLRRFANGLSLAGVAAAVAMSRRRTPVGWSAPRLDRTAGALLLLGLIVWAVVWWSHGALPRHTTPYQTPHHLEFEGGLVVEGYDKDGLTGDLGGYPVAVPGDDLAITLHWRRQSDEDSTSDAQLYVRLSTYRREWAIATLAELPTAGGDPPRMSRGTLHVPTGLPPGGYQLQIGAWSPTKGELALIGYRHTALYSGIASAGVILVTEPSFGDAASGLPNKSDARFGDNVTLLGYEVSPTTPDRRLSPLTPSASQPGPVWSAAAGDPLHLTLLWRAEGDALSPLRVVARLLSPEGDLYAAAHEEPAGGLYPTQYWRSGQLVRDTLDLPIPADTPPGRYRLALELHAQDGPLSLSDPQGKSSGAALTLGEVQLGPAARDLLGLPNGPTTPLAGGIDLVRVEHAPSIGQGERLYVLTHWWGQAPDGRNLLAKIALVDSSGRAWATAEGPPGGESYPTSEWRPNERLRRWFHLPIPADVPDGEYALLASLKVPDGQESAPIEVGRVRVIGRPRRFDMPPGLTPSDAAFGELIALRGYRVGEETTATAAAPGQRLPVLLAWQALQPTGRPLAVSVQLLDAAGPLVAQHDGVPQDGHAPVASWLPGEVVEDRHELALPAGLRPGEYMVAVVVYDTVTGQRLLTQKGADALSLQILTIVP